MEITPDLIRRIQLADTHKVDSAQAIVFKQASQFGWNHTNHTVSYNPQDPNGAEYLLHEVGHAFLAHKAYMSDIELITLERAAWDKACIVGKSVDISITSELIERSLDSYRDWLHARSLCPTCSSTGYQVGNSAYTCPACHQKWRVNEARTCGLKRHKTK